MVLCIITDRGDPSVGIFPRSWEVECPFNKEDTNENELEWFRNGITKLYAECAEGKLDVFYDFELYDETRLI